MLGVCKGVCTSSESYFFFIFFPSSFLSLFYPKKKIPHLQLPPSSTTGIASGVFLLLLLLLLLLFSPFRWRRWVGTKRWEEVGSRRRVVGFKSCSKQSSRLSIVVRASVGRRIVAESNVCVCVYLPCRERLSLPLHPTGTWWFFSFFYARWQLKLDKKKN